MTAPLWLALYLPKLALDVFDNEGAPAVVVARHRVVVCNAEAEDAGILPGMGLAAALSLVPSICVHARRPELESAALNELACWAGYFTPHVHLAEPPGLLLEIGGCLRLFGGLEALYTRIAQECRALGYAVSMALAPTPRAAQWLACAAPDRIVVQRAELFAALGALPIAALHSTVAQHAQLKSWGMATLADVQRMPSASLRLRLGSEFVTVLAQALGDAPDIRTPFVFPRHFQLSLELPAPVEHAAALMFVARRLIGALCGWLTNYALGIVECALDFTHRASPSSRLSLRFVEPLRDAGRIERVCRERLERHTLQAPVESITLRALDTREVSGTSGELFADVQQHARVPEIIERLRARLGEGRVHGLQLVADYRPECAQRRAASGGGQNEGVRRGRRPVWLLPEARALPEVRSQPFLDAPLRLLRGPERIESGWWDQGEAEALGAIKRDYFIARAETGGPCLWIYRDSQGWWLHGVF